MKGRLKQYWRILSLIVLLIAMPVTLSLLQNATNFFSRAGGVNANLVVDLGTARVANPSVWTNFAQGGEERVNMLASVSGKVRSLNATYIRLDHIYDFYNVVGREQSGNLTYNWALLDTQVKGILDSGAKPFFSLSYMPPVISSGTEVDNPVNWFEWQEVVQKTVEHYSGTGNLGIRGVYYEVWNEPDLFGQYKLYGSKNYLTLYKYASLGAEKAQNVYPYKLGGPATTGLYKNWVIDFLTFTRENNLKVDFYSWHRYSSDMNVFDADLRLVEELKSSFPEYGSLELVISETGYSSANDPAYDTNLSAIHTLASVAVFDQEIDKLFSFELKDGPGPAKRWGRWGLLTHEKYGVPEEKPRYKAFQFLNEIIGKHVEISGEGSWVRALARLTPEKLSLLVVNYDPLGKHNEAVPVSFSNLPKSQFTFIRKDFLGETSKPREITTEGNTWNTIELLKPNSASVFELIFE